MGFYEWLKNTNMGIGELGARTLATPIYAAADTINRFVANPLLRAAGTGTQLPTNMVAENAAGFTDAAKFVAAPTAQVIPTLTPTATTKPATPTFGGEAPVGPKAVGATGVPVNPVSTKVPIGGTGFALVGDKKINYADIGTERDPLRRLGGFVMTSGGGASGVDPVSGVAVADAATRQAALDASGVGTTQTLGQRLNSIDMGRGPGGIINAVMQSKVARDDRKRFVGDTKLGMEQQQLDDTRDYQMGTLQNAFARTALDQATTPVEIEMKKALTGYYSGMANAANAKAVAGSTTQDKEVYDLVKHFTGKDKDPATAVDRTTKALLLTTGKGQSVETPAFSMNGQRVKLRGVVPSDMVGGYGAALQKLQDLTNAYNRQWFRTGEDKAKFDAQRMIILQALKDYGVDVVPETETLGTE